MSTSCAATQEPVAARGANGLRHSTVGPTCRWIPGYFRAKIYAVKRKELAECLVLYNRAVSDCDGQIWSKKDLIYSFIQALPEEVSQALARDLGFAMGHENLVEPLYLRAPEPGSSGLTHLHQ